jgi:hypothetical protein
MASLDNGRKIPIKNGPRRHPDLISNGAKKETRSLPRSNTGVSSQHSESEPELPKKDNRKNKEKKTPKPRTSAPSNAKVPRPFKISEVGESAVSQEAPPATASETEQSLASIPSNDTHTGHRGKYTDTDVDYV